MACLYQYYYPIIYLSSNSGRFFKRIFKNSGQITEWNVFFSEKKHRNLEEVSNPHPQFKESICCLICCQIMRYDKNRKCQMKRQKKGRSTVAPLQALCYMVCGCVQGGVASPMPPPLHFPHFLFQWSAENGAAQNFFPKLKARALGEWTRVGSRLLS